MKIFLENLLLRQHPMKNIIITIVVFILSSCAHLKEIGVNEEFNNKNARSGKYICHIVKAQCADCHVKVRMEIREIKDITTRWIPLVYVMLTDLSQDRCVNIGIQYNTKEEKLQIYKSERMKDKYYNVKIIGETRTSKWEIFDISWNNEYLKINHKKWKKRIKLDFAPYSFGWVISGVKANILYENSNVVTDTNSIEIIEPKPRSRHKK